MNTVTKLLRAWTIIEHQRGIHVTIRHRGMEHRAFRRADAGEGRLMGWANWLERPHGVDPRTREEVGQVAQSGDPSALVFVATPP